MTSIDTLIQKQERKLDLEIEILEAQLAEIRAKSKQQSTPQPVERRNKYELKNATNNYWDEVAL